MATFASQMANDVNAMNRALRQTISTMGSVADGVKTFLNLAQETARIPQRTTRDILTPGGFREIDITPRPPAPYEAPTIGMRRGQETRQVVEAINNLGNTIQRTFGGTAGATIRAKGGY
jgi:hypothetical protein